MHTMRRWIGNLMVVVMLFSHSAMLWAKVNVPVHSQEVMQHNCHSKQSQPSQTHKQCKMDCCKDGKLCAGTCLSCCVTGGALVMPVTITTLLPHFLTESITLSLSPAPDGTDKTVLDRPPRYNF